MSSSSIKLRRMQDSDREAVVRLVFESTNAWYKAHFDKNVFGGEASSCRVFPEVYEALDPGCCIIAEDESNGRLAGSCFFHPRQTHYSLGIMNAHPDYFGQGVATRILDEILAIADADAKPVRLVSSAMNLDSFSLYTRRGFVPYATFQDMILPVPDGGLEVDPPEGLARVRDAVPGDAVAMADLEMKLNGIRREKDFVHFIENAAGIWGVSVIEGEDGGIDGFLCSVRHEGSKMLGPGVSARWQDALALVFAELNARHRGGAPVFLVPVDQGQMVSRLYGWGARNCEMHLGQVRGECPPVNGVLMPTFMPETG
ncbi:MAG: GNAT family N-acetyltransferase [Verrucomicrobiota bacterium]|nr:GNAT family N-acetyltransferase [Verrucomicrobiota bacterium]